MEPIMIAQANAVEDVERDLPRLTPLYHGDHVAAELHGHEEAERIAARPTRGASAEAYARGR